MNTIDRLLPLVPYILKIEEPNRSAMVRLYTVEQERLHLCPGSTHNHQVWPGGYTDHLLAMLQFAKIIFAQVSPEKGLSFGDLALVIFLHDIEKPWKYVSTPTGEKIDFKNELEISEFRQRILERYGFQLAHKHLNALKYAHGEGADYRADKRVMNELAALLHICDVWSARVQYDLCLLDPL